MPIKRPMKAPNDPITNEDLQKLKYPLYGSPKLDGFRCTVDKRPYTSSMKWFANPFVNQELQNPIYDGLDGELVVGDPKDGPTVFRNTSSLLRRHYGEPDFRFYVMDSHFNPQERYLDRWIEKIPQNKGRIIVLHQRLLHSPEEVIAYEKEMLAFGYEGAMIRSPFKRYKEGRCTFREMNIFKRKPFVEIEAVVVGYLEGMTNENEAVVNEMGLTKRSHCKENMFPNGKLGSFILKSPLWADPFKASLGKDFDDKIKYAVWTNRSSFMGTVVTIKYQKYGSYKAPRIASVIKLHGFEKV